MINYDSFGVEYDMMRKIMRRSMMVIPFLALFTQAQTSSRYRELKSTIDANVGFAHLTRGVNMYTLIALRSCVSANDVDVLKQMLIDKDPIVRMASAQVLVDLGDTGKQAVRERLEKTVKPAERSTLAEALNDAASPSYRPILEYPLTKAERDRIRGCPAKSQ
jgi:HEAT repeat protein